MTGMRIISIAMLISFLVIGVSVSGRAAAESRTPMPTIAKGKGDKCVLPTDYMRRNHMDLLDHHRDETVIKGIRTKKFSLKECISCHAVKGSDGKAITVKDPKHFCASCHKYAAVHIDCFDCHASRPGQTEQMGGLKLKLDKRSVAVLTRYLKGQKK